jgi:hypothetical protein
MIELDIQSVLLLKTHPRQKIIRLNQPRLNQHGDRPDGCYSVLDSHGGIKPQAVELAVLEEA